MARDFSKNLANYISLGNGALGPLLSGGTTFAFSALIYWRTISSGQNDNQVITILNNGTTVGVSFGLDGALSAGNARIRMTVRSVNTDTRHGCSGNTNVPQNTWVQIGGQFSITAQYIDLWQAGINDSSVGSLPYANSTWTYGAPTAPDGIGAYAPGHASDVLTSHFDGLIAELAIWNTIFTLDDKLALGRFRIPSRVRPQNLIAYWPLLGRLSPEIDYRSGKNGTITGSVPQASHPKTFR
jgi:hypothetical protein